MAFKNTRIYKKKLIPPYCELCGYKIFVTRHRIKAGRNGGKYIPGNVIGLCPNHHAEAEKGLIPKILMFNIVHARLQGRELGELDGYNQE